MLLESKTCAAHVPNLDKLGALKGLDINLIPQLSLSLHRILSAQGILAGGSLQKLGGTNPVIGIQIELWHLDSARRVRGSNCDALIFRDAFVKFCR